MAVTKNFDVENPGYTAPGVLQDIRLTDRDVILARTDLPASELKLSNANGELPHQRFSPSALPASPLRSCEDGVR